MDAEDHSGRRESRLAPSLVCRIHHGKEGDVSVRYPEALSQFGRFETLDERRFSHGCHSSDNDEMINLATACLDYEPVLEARSVNDDGLERLRVSIDDDRQCLGVNMKARVRRRPGILRVAQHYDWGEWSTPGG